MVIDHGATPLEVAHEVPQRASPLRSLVEQAPAPPANASFRMTTRAELQELHHLLTLRLLEALRDDRVGEKNRPRCPYCNERLPSGIKPALLRAIVLFLRSNGVTGLDRNASQARLEKELAKLVSELPDVDEGGE